jgi:hypothetical protein
MHRQSNRDGKSRDGWRKEFDKDLRESRRNEEDVREEVFQ